MDLIDPSGRFSMVLIELAFATEPFVTGLRCAYSKSGWIVNDPCDRLSNLVVEVGALTPGSIDPFHRPSIVLIEVVDVYTYSHCSWLGHD
jgi:hypothetical protein